MSFKEDRIKDAIHDKQLWKNNALVHRGNQCSSFFFSPTYSKNSFKFLH